MISHHLSVDIDSALFSWLPGPIPESLGELTNLTELHLNENRLDGKSDPRIVWPYLLALDTQVGIVR